MKSLAKLAVHIIIANLLQTGYQLVGAFGVGRLSLDGVPDVSISTSVIFLKIAFDIDFAFAGSILTVQYFSAGDFEKVNIIAAPVL